MDTFDGACHTFRHARVNVLLDSGQLVFQVVSSLLIGPFLVNRKIEYCPELQNPDKFFMSVSRVYYKISRQFDTKKERRRSKRAFGD